MPSTRASIADRSQSVPQSAAYRALRITGTSAAPTHNQPRGAEPQPALGLDQRPDRASGARSVGEAAIAGQEFAAETLGEGDVGRVVRGHVGT